MQFTSKCRVRECMFMKTRSSMEKAERNRALSFCKVIFPSCPCSWVLFLLGDENIAIKIRQVKLIQTACIQKHVYLKTPWHNFLIIRNTEKKQRTVEQIRYFLLALAFTFRKLASKKNLQSKDCFTFYVDL